MKTKILFLAIVFVGWALPTIVHAEDRAVTIKEKRGASSAAPSNAKYHALIIGSNNYKYLPKLQTAIADAKAVEEILRTQYGFTTKLLIDATREDILNGMNDLRKGLGEKDNLLIYYAGHGEFDKTADKSYWIPVNAERDNPTNWIIADDITSNIKRITSRHILIVSDSCYSGTLTRAVSGDLSKSGERDEFIKKMMEKPSRTLMASGGNEPVADSGGGGHSVFASAFLKALKETEKNVFTAEELFHGRGSVKEMVAGKSDQVPEYNTIKNSGHDGGDFVFQLASIANAGSGLKPKPAIKDETPSTEVSYELSKLREEEAASYFMGVAYLEAREFQKARDKFSEVLNMEREGKWNEKADKGWKRVDKIVRAMGGITLGDVGKEIAMRESVTRGDMAALLADEIKIDKLFAGRIPVKWEIDKQFIPSDILNHHFKEEALTMMKWGVRGLEPIYDQTTKAFLFKPADGITRREFALVLEDVLIKLTGDEKIATAYFGQEKSPFPDVPPTATWYNAVMYMTTRGLMEPELSGEFRVKDLVDGAEAILAIRVLKQKMNIY